MGGEVDPGHIVGLSVLEALQTAATRIMEEEIERAKANFERRVREAVGGVAFRLYREVSVRTRGDELVVTCRLEKGA